ncbi:MAG: sugar phosphate isomerase/epimerase family protein [Fimbriiglobus sp.]
MLTRRRFLGIAAIMPCVAYAIDPIVRPAGAAKLKLSLAAYSFRERLDLKKPNLTLLEFIDLAAGYGVDGVELTSYFFAETKPEYVKALKDRCEKQKLAVTGVPVRSDFCAADPAKRAADIKHVVEWIDVAAALEAPAVRIFAGNLPKGERLDVTQKRVIESIEECLVHAEKKGVVLALENHGGITATPEQLLALVKPIRSKYLGVNVDTGNFKTADPYADIAKIAPYGVTVQVKTEVYPAGKVEEADLSKVVKILREANYHGYVTLEYEAKPDPMTAVPQHLKTLRELLKG